jgi:hypothetical protein
MIIMISENKLLEGPLFPSLVKQAFGRVLFPQLTQLMIVKQVFGWVLTPQLIIWKMDPALLPEYLLNKKWAHPTSQNMGYPVVFQGKSGYF